MTLTSLKQRLEILPTRRRIGEQGARFAAFYERAQKAHVSASEAVTAAGHARLALAVFDEQEVLTRAKKASRRAQRLHKKLNADTDAVSEKSVEESFAALGSESASALKYCNEAWTQTMETKLSGRAVLAEVVAQVLPEKGLKLLQTVGELREAAQRPPQTEARARHVRDQFDRFDKLMNGIGLNDDVGKFLEAVAGLKGAPAAALEKPAVRKFLDDHKLWSVFRIRLQ